MPIPEKTASKLIIGQKRADAATTGGCFFKQKNLRKQVDLLYIISSISSDRRGITICRPLLHSCQPRG